MMTSRGSFSPLPANIDFRVEYRREAASLFLMALRIYRLIAWSMGFFHSLSLIVGLPFLSFLRAPPIEAGIDAASITMRGLEDGGH